MRRCGEEAQAAAEQEEAEMLALEREVEAAIVQGKADAEELVTLHATVEALRQQCWDEVKELAEERLRQRKEVKKEEQFRHPKIGLLQQRQMLQSDP